MSGRRRVLGSSFAASLGVHLALLAAVAVLWVPPVHRTLGDLIPVQLLPVAGDRPAGEPPGPPPRARAERPEPLPSTPAPARTEVQPTRPRRAVAPAPDAALRPAEPDTKGPETTLSASENDTAGPRAVGTGSTSASASEPAGSAGVQGVATALQGLGTGDAIGAAGGSGTSTAPGYRVNPKPEYPAQARERGYQGTVTLKVHVLPDGKAGEISVERSSGHEVLDAAAIRTVKAWLFVPATRNGIAVATWVTVPVRFSLAS